MEERVVGIGVLDPTSADVVLELGQQHPSTHGALRLALTVDGDRIVTAEPIVGYMHRGAEKLFEVRDYRQLVMLANRHDWLSAFSNELGIVLACERMLGMEVPPRATWLRTLMAELNRVLNGLLFLGAFPVSHGELAPLQAAHRARELVQRVMEEATGGRLHFVANRVGGLAQDVPAGWVRRVGAAVLAVRAELELLDGAVASDAFVARTAGVGTLGASDVAAYGITGPVARASGVDMDLRRDDPYLAYPELDMAVVTRTAGDCLARFQCLAEQLHVSLDLAEQCLARLPDGPVGLPLPKTLRVPVGSTWSWTENPLGAMGYYLVSRGQKTPWRLAMRTPSFNNVSALPALLPGVAVADLTTVLASLFFVVGDIDK